MYKHHTYTVSLIINILFYEVLLTSSEFSKHPADKGGYRWNTDRIAEVWLDEFKPYYYREVGYTKDRNFGDISERIAIRKEIGCKPFKWLVDNVFPMEPVPDEITDSPAKTNQEKQGKQ